MSGNVDKTTLKQLLSSGLNQAHEEALELDEEVDRGKLET